MMRTCNNTPRDGFTLLEMLVAIGIMAALFGIAYTSFNTVTRAWRKGNELSEDLTHGDYVMEQLVWGLRSAYYPDVEGDAPDYGFLLEDGGDGASSSDTISWVKIGHSMTRGSNPEAQGPHRVEFLVESYVGAMARHWRLYGKDEEFDHKVDIEPETLSQRVTGFNCRISTNLTDEGWEWMDEWEEEDGTNHLPLAVEVTLYMQPDDLGDPVLTYQRSVEIPVGPLSWQEKSTGSRQSGNAARDRLRRGRRQGPDGSRTRPPAGVRAPGRPTG